MDIISLLRNTDDLVANNAIMSRALAGLASLYLELKVQDRLIERLANKLSFRYVGTNGFASKQTLAKKYGCKTDRDFKISMRGVFDKELQELQMRWQ